VANGCFCVLQPILELLKHPDFLSNYNLVVVSGPIKRSSLDPLTDAAESLGIPLIYVRSVGFYSVFSLQLPSEFPIVETHPDPESTQDLRLLNPWPELHAAASAITNIDVLDDHDHGHVPYILILLYYLDKWKAGNGGKAPENYKEKTAFREFVRAAARTNTPEGGEENFDEAVSAVLKSINPWSLRSNIREIFEMEKCKNLEPESDNFWIIASALKDFHAKHAVLPLPGSVPDMKAKSADYIALQNIYKSKASQDIKEVLNTVRTIEAQLGSRTVPIAEKEVEVFCKNASHVKVIRGRRIPRVTIDASQTLKAARSNFGNPDSEISVYVAFEALDAIVDGIQNGRLPATALDDDATWDATIERLLLTIAEDEKTLVDGEEVRNRTSNAAKELRRTEGGELHNISSLTGGLVSQEALKVLTRQYVPLDNTCLFDGIGSRSEMFRL
jgi:NEDD8-activating enzyme E1 regulatory subunit